MVNPAFENANVKVAFAAVIFSGSRAEKDDPLRLYILYDAIYYLVKWFAHSNGLPCSASRSQAFPIIIVCHLLSIILAFIYQVNAFCIFTSL